MNKLYYGDNLNILRRYGGNTRGSKCVPAPQPSTGAEQTDTLPTGRVSALIDNVLFKDESGLEADSVEWLSADTWYWKGAGRLPARTLGSQYVIKEADLKLVADRKPGRPAKVKDTK